MFHGKFQLQSDIFSFGVLIHDLYTRQQVLPFAAFNNDQYLQALRRQQRVPELQLPDECPDVLKTISGECLAMDCRSRPPFAAIVHRISHWANASLNELSRDRLEFVETLGEGATWACNAEM